jgi:Tfp pilus assembly protein FimT
MVEVMMVLAVSAIGFRVVSRPIGTYLSRSRSRSAAQVIASDLELARSVAMRQRQPVRLSWDATTQQYTIKSRSGASVFRTVSIGATSDYHIASVQFSPASVDFFPNGVASSALAVTLTTGATTRTVTLSRVGLIRVP